MDNEQESSRLEDKVDQTDFVRNYLDPIIGTKDAILDVGCGPGVITSTIAQKFPETEVVGLDLSKPRFKKEETSNTNLKNLRYVCGDATDLPFQNDVFDVVFCRFLLEYIDRPQHVISELKRVCKTGGKILLQDLDGQLVQHYPIDATLQQDIECVLTHLSHTGFDPYIGRKLYSLAKAELLEIDNVLVEPYHLIAGKVDPFTQDLWERKLEIALPSIEEALGDKQLAIDFKNRFIEYFQRDDTFTFSNAVTLYCTKP